MNVLDDQVSDLDPMGDNEKAGGQTGGQTSGQTQLTERQHDVLDLINQDNRISRKKIADVLGIAESAVQKHIKVLTSSKIIERVGTYNGYWKILVNH